MVSAALPNESEIRHSLNQQLPMSTASVCCGVVDGPAWMKKVPSVATPAWPVSNAKSESIAGAASTSKGVEKAPLPSVVTETDELPAVSDPVGLVSYQTLMPVETGNPIPVTVTIDPLPNLE